MNLDSNTIALLLAYGYLLLFVIVLVEEAGLPLPLPSDLVLLYAGSLVASGNMSLPMTIAVALAATMIGTTVLYTTARYAGQPVVQRYGRWLRLDEWRLRRAERWLGQHTVLRLAALRLVPGLRVYSTAAAGILRLPLGRSALAFAISAAVWASLWIGLGALLGPNLGRVAALVGRANYIAALAFGIGLTLLVAILLVRWARRKSSRATPTTLRSFPVVSGTAVLLLVSAVFVPARFFDSDFPSAIVEGSVEQGANVVLSTDVWARVAHPWPESD